MVLVLALALVVALTTVLFQRSPAPPPEGDPLRRDERWLAAITASADMNVEAIYRRGMAEWEAGHLNRAKVAFNRALEMEPNNVEVMRALGQVAYVERDYPTAREYFEHDLRARPDAQEAYANLAIVLVCMDHLDDAQMVLELGLERLPEADCGPLYVIMACVMVRLQRLDQEALYLQQAYSRLGRDLPLYVNAPWAAPLRTSNQFRARLKASGLDVPTQEDTEPPRLPSIPH